MVEPRMVQVCPKCGNPGVYHRGKHQPACYCHTCKAEFDEPVIRPHKNTITELEPIPDDYIRACPTCDNPTIHFRTRRHAFICYRCGTVTTEPTIRKRYWHIPTNKITCPYCGGNAEALNLAQKPYYRCHRCYNTFVMKAEAPKSEP